MYIDEEAKLHSLLENAERRLSTSHRICMQQEIDLIQARKDVKHNAEVAKAAQDAMHGYIEELSLVNKENKGDKSLLFGSLIVWLVTIIVLVARS